MMNPIFPDKPELIVDFGPGSCFEKCVRMGTPEKFQVFVQSMVTPFQIFDLNFL